MPCRLITKGVWSMEKEKLKRIKHEKNKLNRIFKNIDEKRRKTVERLIDNAAFMAATLEDLQEDINQNGVISEYQNGENQWGTKKSPEVEVYNTMLKNYTSVIKQLTDLLPPEEGKEDDGFDAFING